MAWTVAHAESFPLDLGRAPKKVRNAWQRTVLPILAERPDKSDPPAIKKLTGFKDLWRLRVSDDYRLIYRVDNGAKTVVLILLDHRSKVYERAGVHIVDGEATPAPTIIVQAPDLLQEQPTAEETGRAEIESAADNVSDAEGGRTLARPIDEVQLEAWGVPEEYRCQFTGVKTENELIAVSGSVPDAVMEQVLNGLWPPPIQKIIQEPVRSADSAQDILAAAEGERDLDSFLLRLDAEQQAFVGRFDSANPTGPWLLKGGPGSGKSTVALYCIASLVNRQAQQLPLGQRPLKILFTTYTHSLTNAAMHLLRSMGIEDSGKIVDVVNVDKLAGRDMPRGWHGRRILTATEARDHATAVLAECLLDDKRFPFTRSDVAFLLDEIDWVIVGQSVDSQQGYLAADRTGRGRALSEAQRRQVWTCWTKLKSRLESHGTCMFSQRLQAAASTASPRYDYVFIDEAQDLKPVAIRYLVRLCHAPEKVFLTADSNQSIYGTGMSWSRVAEDLRFSGRARILRRNYRTTQEIWQAVSDFASQGADRETLDVEAVYSGPYPMLFRYSSMASRAAALNDYLIQSLLRDRLPASCAAVLCPTSREAEAVAASLAPELKAKAMKSKNTDLSHPGVKVLTMHAAKGLQFPVVAVAGLQFPSFPKPVPAGMDAAEHDTRQKRLLFVACSRAMRQLALFAPRQMASRYVEDLSDEYWEILDVG